MSNNYNEYIINSLVRIDTGDGFRDGVGNLVDPTTVSLKILQPDGDILTPAVAKDNVGLYHYDVTLDQEGWWFYYWRGEGAIIAAAENRFFVKESKFF